MYAHIDIAFVLPMEQDKQGILGPDIFWKFRFMLSVVDCLLYKENSLCLVLMGGFSHVFVCMSALNSVLLPSGVITVVCFIFAVDVLMTLVMILTDCS